MALITKTCIYYCYYYCLAGKPYLFSADSGFPDSLRPTYQNQENQPRDLYSTDSQKHGFLSSKEDDVPPGRRDPPFSKQQPQVRFIFLEIQF